MHRGSPPPPLLDPPLLPPLDEPPLDELEPVEQVLKSTMGVFWLHELSFGPARISQASAADATHEGPCSICLRSCTPCRCCRSRRRCRSRGSDCQSVDGASRRTLTPLPQASRRTRAPVGDAVTLTRTRAKTNASAAVRRMLGSAEGETSGREQESRGGATHTQLGTMMLLARAPARADR